MSSLHQALLEKIFATAPEAGDEAPFDVDAHLDALAADRGGECEWRISIVDLLNLLDLDSSYETRQKMAAELGYSKEDRDSRGSAELNLWLLKQVFAKIVERGARLEATLPG
jgi:hypothetical protein